MQTVGVLLSRTDLRRAIRGQGFESLPAYQLAARPMGLTVVFFAPEGVRWHSGTVRGLVYHRGAYRPVHVPVPPVVHRRIITSRRRERWTVAQLARLPGVSVFNPPASRDKLVMHGRLRRALPGNLPQTRPLRGPKTILEMLKRHASVFLKPTLGSAGRGVYRLIRLRDGRVGIASWAGRRLALPPRRLGAWLKSLRKGRYLVQQGLDLARYQGLPFDVRVWVQRGGDGRWHVTGMWPRVAHPDRPVSNMARGGRMVELDRVLREAFPDQAPAALTDQLQRLALAVARQLGRRIRGLGDLGLDLAFDRDGKAWFLEANLRQQRWSLRELGCRKGAFFTQYRWPMAYAAYLLRRGARG